MIPGVLLLVGLVQGGWTISPAEFTVGDTVVAERSIVFRDPAIRLRVGALESNDDFQAIRPPVVDYVAGGAIIRYFVAAFQTSAFAIDPPDVDLVHPEGPIETRPGGVIRLQPTSILPTSSSPDSLPAPQWSQPPIPRGTARYDSAILFAFLVLTFATVWGVARRRIGARPVWDQTPTSVLAPVTQWVTAGEPRAVAALIMTRLREDLADRVPEATEALSIEQCLKVLHDRRPHWPLERLSDILQSVARASFAPAVPSDVLVTVDEVKELHSMLDAADSQTGTAAEPNADLASAGIASEAP